MHTKEQRQMLKRLLQAEYPNLTIAVRKVKGGETGLGAWDTMGNDVSDEQFKAISAFARQLEGNVPGLYPWADLKTK
jgi:hypothetical protein